MSASHWKDELGVASLHTKTGEKDVGSVLNGKYVMLYFSAHWCPPCRSFTPQLAKFYNHLKAKRDDFEIVFVSSDREEEQWKEYYNEHPWTALPYNDRKAKDKLSRKFKVNGIPTLLVLDKDGKLITDSGREMVGKDEEGAKFPWAPRSLYDILATAKMTKKGAPLTVADLKAMPNFSVYFSAHWCGPCRGFTPKLVETYNHLLTKFKTEILFVSADHDEKSFNDYYNEMPWATVAFNDGAVGELNSLYKVQGIPTLVTINAATGEAINSDARAAAAKDPEGAKFPWAPEPLPAICEFQPEDNVIEALNSEVCVIYHKGAGGSDSAEAAFRVAGTRFDKEKNATAADNKVRFFVCGKGGDGEELYGRVLQALGLGEPAAVLAFNLSNGRAKETLAAATSDAEVFNFVAKFVEAQA